LALHQAAGLSPGPGQGHADAVGLHAQLPGQLPVRIVQDIPGLQQPAGVLIQTGPHLGQGVQLQAAQHPVLHLLPLIRDLRSAVQRQPGMAAAVPDGVIGRVAAGGGNIPRQTLRLQPAQGVQMVDEPQQGGLQHVLRGPLVA